MSADRVDENRELGKVGIVVKYRISKFVFGVAVVAGAVGVGAPALAATPSVVGVGLKTQSPAEGGTWQYGFQNAALRSYYTVNKCHGSTVEKRVGSKVTDTSRSINTASGKKSIAEITAVNTPNLNANYYYRVC